MSTITEFTFKVASVEYQLHLNIMMLMTPLVSSIYAHTYDYVEIKKQKSKQSEQRRLQRKRSQRTHNNARYSPPDKQ